MSINVIHWKTAELALTALIGGLEKMLEDISVVAEEAEEREAESTQETASNAAESLVELVAQARTVRHDLDTFREEWPAISGLINRAFNPFGTVRTGQC